MPFSTVVQFCPCLPKRKSELTYAAIVDAALDGRRPGWRACRWDRSPSTGHQQERRVRARVRAKLLQAVLDEYDRRFVAAVFTPALEQPRGLPRMNAMVTHWIDRACNVETLTGCIYVAGAFEYDDRESPLRPLLENNVRRWRAALVRTAGQALEAGHLRPDTDPEQLVFEIYSLMVGLMHDARFLRDPQAHERVRKAYERLISTYRSFSYIE